MGIHKVKPNHTLFYRHSKEEKNFILIVYVDDIILTCDDHVEQERLKRVLTSDFEIKDLGGLKYFQERYICISTEICVRLAVRNEITWL